MTNFKKDEYNPQKSVFYEFISTDDYNKGEVLNTSTGEMVKIAFLSKEFKSKMSRIDMEVINFLRCQLVFIYGEKQDYKKHFITAPKDLKFELFLFQNFIDIYTEILMRYSRADYEDEDMIKDADANFKNKMVAQTELSYKMIANEQIKLAHIIMEILKGLDDKKYMTMNEAYRSVRTNKEKQQEEFISNRLKIKKYLKSLYYGSKLI